MNGPMPEAARLLGASASIPVQVMMAPIAQTTSFASG